MLDDLEDLMDEPKQKTTVAAKNSLNKFGGGNNTGNMIKDEFDDLNDDNWGPQNNSRSASNARPPTKINHANEKSEGEKGSGQWWGSKGDLKPSGSKTGLNSSFGGSQGLRSGQGSRKSKAEEEADELEAMLGDIVGDPKPNTDLPSPGAPQPTGTFRENEGVKDDDGWGKINNSARGSNAGKGPRSRTSK